MSLFRLLIIEHQDIEESVIILSHRCIDDMISMISEFDLYDNYLCS